MYDPRDPAAKAAVQLSRLRRRLDNITAIDFFQTPERAAAELQLKELKNLPAGQPAPAPPWPARVPAICWERHE